MYRLQVVTPEQIIFDDEVLALVAPGVDGYLGVLTDHAPLLVSLKVGILIITDNNNKQSYFNISNEIDIRPLKNYILEFFYKESEADPVLKLQVLKIIKSTRMIFLMKVKD